MGYARHVGRVGGLAVAMGVGFGIAGAPGAASADTGSEATSSTSPAPDSKTNEAPPNSLATTVSSAVHEILSAIERASGAAKTGTTASNSSSTPDPRHGTVQSSGGAITSTSPGSAGAGEPGADPVKPKSVTAFHVPTSIVNSARVVSEDLDGESPPPTGPTHE